jgi:hypothetical protein
MLHDRAACLCFMSKVHVNAACSSCSLRLLHVACPFNMCVLHAHDVFPRCMSFLHFLAVQYVCAACPCQCCMSLKCKPTCPCCMSLLNVHAACSCHMSMRCLSKSREMIPLSLEQTYQIFGKKTFFFGEINLSFAISFRHFVSAKFLSHFFHQTSCPGQNTHA